MNKQQRAHSANPHYMHSNLRFIIIFCLTALIVIIISALTLRHRSAKPSTVRDVMLSSSTNTLRTPEPYAVEPTRSLDYSLDNAFRDNITTQAQRQSALPTGQPEATNATPPSLFAELTKRLGSNVWIGSIDTTLTTAWHLCADNRLVINPALLTPALLAGLTNYGGIFFTVPDNSVEVQSLLSLLGQRAIRVPGYGYYMTPDGIAPGSQQYSVLKAHVLEAAFQVESNGHLAKLLAATYLSCLHDDNNAIRVLQTMLPGDLGDAYCIAARYENDPALKRKYYEESIRSYWNSYIRTSDSKKAYAARGMSESYRDMGDSDNELKYLKECYNYSSSMGTRYRNEYADTVMSRLMSLGRYDEARDWYSCVNDPSPLQIYRARLYEKDGDLNNAIYTAGKAPQTIDNLFYLGSLYKKTQNTRDAEWTLGKINQQISTLPPAEQARIKNSAEYKKLVQ